MKNSRNQRYFIDGKTVSQSGLFNKLRESMTVQSSRECYEEYVILSNAKDGTIDYQRLYGWALVRRGLDTKRLALSYSFVFLVQEPTWLPISNTNHWKTNSDD